jgi:hypothetical protein
MYFCILLTLYQDVLNISKVEPDAMQATGCFKFSLTGRFLGQAEKWGLISMVFLVSDQDFCWLIYQRKLS